MEVEKRESMRERNEPINELKHVSLAEYIVNILLLWLIEGSICIIFSIASIIFSVVFSLVLLSFKKLKNQLG